MGVATNQTQRMLQALAEAGARTPDLKDYYEFHRTLCEILDQARADISGALPAEVEGALRTRLVEGSPLLSFDQLPVQGERFANLVATIAQALTDYTPELGKQGVPDSPAECLRLARQRFEEGQVSGQRTSASTSTEPGEVSVEPSGPPEAATLAHLSVDLALRPYLEWGAEQLRPYVEAQGAWRRGYCPICGGAPDFASLDEESGARHLLCSRCNTQWPYHRLGCPFCGTTDHTKLFYYPSDDGVYRLYVCQECRRYLKTIDLRQARHAVLLPLERVTSVAMDAAALEEGYR